MASKDDDSFVDRRSPSRFVDKVEVKIDKLIDLNETQIEDIRDVKEEISNIKDNISELSSRMSVHFFEDATKFTYWESKFEKDIEPVLKYANERIALGGWIKGNQKIVIFVILCFLTVVGIVKVDQILLFLGIKPSESQIEQKSKDDETNKTSFQNSLEKSFSENE